MRHDVIAFTTAVAESMQSKGAAEASRWLHYGLTSSDIVDTAQALQIKEASKLITSGLERFSAALKQLAFEHRHTVQIGRTHGMHAEPITFGLKVALWWDEFERHSRRFAAAAEEMRVGKISGAVGTFANLSSGSGRKNLPTPRIEGGADQLSGFVARSACELHRDARRDRFQLGQNRPRNTPSPAHRGSRGGRAFCRWTKRLVRNAA